MCEIELELPQATETLKQLSAGVHRSDPREVVRAAACGLTYQHKLGLLDPAEADKANELLSLIADPLVESAFQSAYSNTLALAARYDEALAVAMGLLSNANRYRLDFAVPYALCSAGMAYAGLREWQHVERCLDEAIEVARVGRDSGAEQSCFAVLLRALAQQGRQEEALALEVPSLGGSIPANRGEVLSSRALALASVGRVDEAVSMVTEVRGITHAVEPAVLVAVVDAVVALKRRDGNALDRVAKLESIAFSTGALDLLVAAYRSTPDLLVVLLRAEATRERTVALIRRVGDEDLARAVGSTIGSSNDPRERLSRREREVYDLLRQGLTNRQIAEVLFISESTVKRHAIHVYDKVGVRSRTALAVQAALERTDQATSATVIPDDEAVS
jgi:DNA-binding CsgD family transcriptional regulator